VEENGSEWCLLGRRGELPELAAMVLKSSSFIDQPVHQCAARSRDTCLVPSLIEGLRVVQGLRVVPVFLYRYSMIKYTEKGS